MAAARYTVSALYICVYSPAALVGLIVVSQALKIPPVTQRYLLGGNDINSRCVAKYHCSIATQEIRECSCHPHCYLFDSCCVDATLPPDWLQLQVPSGLYTCISLGALTNAGLQSLDYYYAIYVVDRCPRAFPSSRLASLCQHPLDQMLNGTLSALVTDSSSGATYRNIYCALCHDSNFSLIQNWNYGYYCNGTSNTTVNNDNRNSYSRNECILGYVPPINITLHGCRGNCIRSCPGNTSISLQNDCSNGATQYVYDQGNKTVYRNGNCSLCNANPGTQLYCTAWPELQYVSTSTPSLSLIVLLTADYRCPTTLTPYMSVQEQTVWKYLCPDVYDYRMNLEFSNCTGFPNKQTLEELYTNGTYFDYGISSQHVQVRYNSTYAACAECTRNVYPMNVTDNQTNVTVNGIFFVRPFFKKVGGEVMVCSALIPDEFFLECPNLPEIVGIVLMVLSELGLGLYACVYALFKSLQNLPGKIMLHESIAFFMGFLLFLLRGVASDSELACEIVGILVHFFFLAAFSWTFIYAIEVTRALGFQAYGAGYQKRGLRYMLIGWAVPALIMIASIVTNFASDNNPFRPNYGRPQCFINSPFGNRIFFMAPLAVFLSIDIVIYTYTIVKLIMISKETKMVRDNHNEKLILSAKLIFALGMLWIFAILGAVTSNCILIYIFQFLNTLQGVSIFVIFVCNKKTMTLLRLQGVGGKSTRCAIRTIHLRDSSMPSENRRMSRKSKPDTSQFSSISTSVETMESATSSS